MDMTVLQFLAAPFVASLILTGIHAYLGVHVVERGGVIFQQLFERGRGELTHVSAHAESVCFGGGKDLPRIS